MIQNVIHRLFHRRHFWRYTTFSEIGELYASRLMRLFALQLVSIFTSIYMFQIGYSLVFIAVFWAGFFGLKIIFSWPTARLIAEFGPKHAMLISNILAAVGMVFLPFAADPVYGLWALIAWSILQAYSGCMSHMAYLIDFSKIKNMQHAGKEIGFMNIIEKVAMGLSPFIGGLVAYIFGPEAVMLLAAVLFLASAVPLFATGEPTKLRQHLNFRAYPWRTTWRSLAAQASIGVDVYATGIAWSIFVGLIVFGVDTNQVYAELGFVTSIALFVAIVASYGYGRIIDNRQGGALLRLATLCNSGVHAMRIFATTPIGVVVANIASEAATAGHRMPFLRGMFDMADRSGKRVEYLFLVEMIANAGAMAASLLLAGLFYVTTAELGLQFFFVIAGLLTLFIATPRFLLYRG